MRKMSFVLLCLLAGIMGAKAQIGYQIALLNTATGEARANETVTVSVSLSNSANEVFYSETKTATTNDFGILSLSIGNADTFNSVDFSKMPFFIEVSANGVNIGKSQMLSVPIAEYAKRTGDLSNEMLEGTWIYEYDLQREWDSEWYTYDKDGNRQVTHNYVYFSYARCREKLIFYSNGTCKYIGHNRSWTVGQLDHRGDPRDDNHEYDKEGEYKYTIEGNRIVLWWESESDNQVKYTYKSSPYIRFARRELEYYSSHKIIIGDMNHWGGVFSKQ